MQVVLFTNDKTISKGMVKYASNLSRESIIDVEGTIVVPQEPVVACTQSQVQCQYLSTCLILYHSKACHTTCLQSRLCGFRVHLSEDQWLHNKGVCIRT